MNSQRLVYTTTFAMRMLEKVLKAKFIVHGQEFIELSKHHPCVFVVNHFTRAETFILPYMIYKLTNEIPHSLADGELFIGKFGDYLRTMGAMPTTEPRRNEIIISELMKGSNDWVIFPEGMMVKNKSIFEKGKFIIGDVEGHRGPRTGSAVMALQAAMIKKVYFKAIENKNIDLQKEIEAKYSIEHPSQISQKEIAIIPVNITYYPIRPGTNLLHSIALKFFKDMPKRVQEELEIEGNLLLKNTDIHITFNRPFYPSDYLFDENLLMKTMLNLMPYEKKEGFTLWYQKSKLTNSFMKVIYESVTINFDHIFCATVRNLPFDEISIKELGQRIYVIIYELKRLNKHLHDNLLDESLIQILTDQEYEPMKNIIEVGIKYKNIEVVDGVIKLQRANMLNRHLFHNVRLHNTMRVIANEIEPLQDVIKLIKRNSKHKLSTIRKKIVSYVSKSDIDIFEHDYKKYYDAELSKPPEIGTPFFLQNSKSQYGVVLSHGYLAAPAEVRLLAEHLNSVGFNVYVVRLRGHGTAPVNLSEVKWRDWYLSYLRGIAVIQNHCEHYFYGGFSSGGLVAMIHSSNEKLTPLGTFVINAPLRLKDLKAKLVPAVKLWNDLLGLLHIDGGKLECVDNHTESPDINYTKNYLNGVQQLGKMMDECENRLGNIFNPVRILQSDEDPTVDPISGELIIQKIKSETKSLIKMHFKRHVIVRKEGCEEVFEKISEFLLSIVPNPNLTK